MVESALSFLSAAFTPEMLLEKYSFKMFGEEIVKE